MKRTRWVVGLFLTALMAAGALGLQETFTFKRIARVGDTMNYKFQADADFQGQQLVITGGSVDKVVRVEDNGNIHVETKQIGMKVKFADQEMEVPEQPASVIVYGDLGQVVSMQGDQADASSYRMANLSMLRRPDLPMKVGDKWTAEMKGDRRTGAVNGRAEYEVLAVETVNSFPAIKVKYSYRETEGPDPASAEGSIWIHREDGSLVKLMASFVNAPLPGAPAPANMKMSIERVR